MRSISPGAKISPSSAASVERNSTLCSPASFAFSNAISSALSTRSTATKQRSGFCFAISVIKPPLPQPISSSSETPSPAPNRSRHAPRSASGPVTSQGAQAAIRVSRFFFFRIRISDLLFLVLIPLLYRKRPENTRAGTRPFGVFSRRTSAGTETGRIRVGCRGAVLLKSIQRAPKISAFVFCISKIFFFFRKLQKYFAFIVHVSGFAHAVGKNLDLQFFHIIMKSEAALCRFLLLFYIRRELYDIVRILVWAHVDRT